MQYTRRVSLRILGGFSILVFVAACGDDTGGAADARRAIDAPVIDAPGQLDAPVIDAPLADAAVVDAPGPQTDGRADALFFDAGPFPSGVTTLAGSGPAGYFDAFRTDARLNNPANVAVASDGTIYIADFDNSMIRAVTDWGDVTTLTNQGNFSRPFGMVASTTGVLYVQTDRNLQLINGGALWSINTTTGAATLLFNNVGRARGLAELSDGRLVLAFYQEHVIKIYNPATPTTPPSVVAGGQGTPGMVNDTGTAARFNEPYDVVAISANEVVVADKSNYRLRLVNIDTGVVTTYAGNGNAASGDGPVASASFNLPQGLAIDGSGNIYVSELGGYVLRKISGGNVSTIAGDGNAGFLDSTAPLTAQFWGLEGIDVTSDGSVLYIADGNRGTGMPYNRVRRMTLP